MKILLFLSVMHRALAQNETAPDKCALFQASCDNFQFDVAINETCLLQDWDSMDPSLFYAAGGSNETADNGCQFLKDNVTDVWGLKISVNECGISPVSDAQFIKYPLVILNSADSSQANGGSSLIYRVAPGTKAELACQYNRRVNLTQGGWEVISESEIIQTSTIESPENEADLQSMFDLEVADSELSALANATGLELGTLVPFEIEMTNNSDPFDFRIDDCWATPDSDPANAIQFPLADQGCPTESWINVTTNAISFDLFAFFNHNDFYMHCGLMLCDKNDAQNCQAQTCSPTDRRRRSIGEAANILSSKLMIDPNSYTEGHIVSTMDGVQLILFDQEAAAEAGEIIAVLSSNAMQTVLGLFAFCLLSI